MTVRVVTDSGSDLPPALCEELGIEVVPLTIRFGDEALTDRQDLTAAEFWARCQAAPALPETAAPSPGTFQEACRRAQAGGADGVVVVTLSAKMSATIQAAQLAAEALAGDPPVRVVDSGNASLGEGMVALVAARAAAAGGSLDEVEEAARSAARRTTLFAAIDTLDNLRRGGRIGGAQALLGGLLSIKPLITVSADTGGEVAEAGKQRTRAKALNVLLDKVRAVGPVEALGLMHAEAPDVDQLLARLDDIVPREDIIVADVGAVIGTHVGPGCIGVVTVKAAR
ncbi:MAG: DegV family protein [Acidimicrobiales bacterium]